MARIRPPNPNRRIPTEKEKLDAQKRIDAVLKSRASEAAAHCETIKNSLMALLRINGELEAADKEEDAGWMSTWILYSICGVELEPTLRMFEKMHESALQYKKEGRKKHARVSPACAAVEVKAD